MGLPAPVAMPGVDPRLQIVAPRQQVPVVQREPLEHRRHALPERFRLAAQPRQDLVLDKGGQHRRDPQAGAIQKLGHQAILGGGARL